MTDKQDGGEEEPVDPLREVMRSIDARGAAHELKVVEILSLAWEILCGDDRTADGLKMNMKLLNAIGQEAVGEEGDASILTSMAISAADVLREARQLGFDVPVGLQRHGAVAADRLGDGGRDFLSGGS